MKLLTILLLGVVLSLVASKIYVEALIYLCLFVKTQSLRSLCSLPVFAIYILVMAGIIYGLWGSEYIRNTYAVDGNYSFIMGWVSILSIAIPASYYIFKVRISDLEKTGLYKKLF